MTEPKFRFRIERKYKGDLFCYKIQFEEFGTRNCTIRQYCTDNFIEAVIDEDNKHVNLSKATKIQGINGQDPKEITRLKIPPNRLSQVREQVEGKLV